ncbi:MAG: extensin family protein [Labilithrix sp.]|nr:extensin family protein [Labilithrix sp.]
MGILLAGCAAAAPAGPLGPRETGRPDAPAPHQAPQPSQAPEQQAPEQPELEAVEPIAPTRPARRPGAYANDDPDDDLVVGPPDAFASCETDLAAAGVKFRPASLPVHTPPRSKIACGAPQVVVYVRGPGDIAYNVAPVVTCTMALALASFEKIVQAEARAKFNSPVARIDQLGTYSCREMARYPGWVSEHSYANAIDIGAFVLKSGKTVEVLRDFDRGDAPPAKPAGAFLRAVSQRANDEDVFSHVLTPFFDAAHHNHFHLDLSRYRADGTRPR